MLLRTEFLGGESWLKHTCQFKALSVPAATFLSYIYFTYYIIIYTVYCVLYIYSFYALTKPLMAALSRILFLALDCYWASCSSGLHFLSAGLQVCTFTHVSEQPSLIVFDICIRASGTVKDIILHPHAFIYKPIVTFFVTSQFFFTQHK